MGLIHLLSVLYKLRMLTPRGIYRLFSAFFRYGINLQALLYVAYETYKHRIAIVDDKQSLTYADLFRKVEELSKALTRLHIQRGHKIAVLCRNHAELVQLLFALSDLRTDVSFINVEMSWGQLERLMQDGRFDGWIFDDEFYEGITSMAFAQNGSIHKIEQWPLLHIWTDRDIEQSSALSRSARGRIVLLTGGTTGKAKSVFHKPSLFSYLQPFLSFVTRLKVSNYQTAYIATPIYHGYGVAALLIFITFGMKIVLTQKFTVDKACSLIRDHQVEIVTVVPLMIAKMLQHNVEDLRSLRCIASGGAELPPKLVLEVREKLGDVLYNLYGTTETGLCMIATPEDLRYFPRTIGKVVHGNRVAIFDEQHHKVPVGKIGQLCVRNRWSMQNRASQWILTGDLGYLDTRGYYYLCGRIDDMVVSAGENVYPLEVEQEMGQHPDVIDVAVIGVPDEQFGQRLRAFVVLRNGSKVTKDELLQWLKHRVARYQMPREILVVDALPYTPVGKLDKKKLREIYVMDEIRNGWTCSL